MAKKFVVPASIPIIQYSRVALPQSLKAQSERTDRHAKRHGALRLDKLREFEDKNEMKLYYDA